MVSLQAVEVTESPPRPWLPPQLWGSCKAPSFAGLSSSQSGWTPAVLGHSSCLSFSFWASDLLQSCPNTFQTRLTVGWSLGSVLHQPRQRCRSAAVQWAPGSQAEQVTWPKPTFFFLARVRWLEKRRQNKSFYFVSVDRNMNTNAKGSSRGRGSWSSHIFVRPLWWCLPTSCVRPAFLSLSLTQILKIIVTTVLEKLCCELHGTLPGPLPATWLWRAEWAG